MGFVPIGVREYVELHVNANPDENAAARTSTHAQATPGHPASADRIPGAYRKAARQKAFQMREQKYGFPPALRRVHPAFFVPANPYD